MSCGVQSEIFPAFALKMVVPELPAVTCSPSNNRLPDTVRSVSRSSRYIYQHIATCAEYACQQHFWYRNRIDDGERLLESGSIARHKFHQRELALIAHLVREGDDAVRRFGARGRPGRKLRPFRVLNCLSPDERYYANSALIRISRVDAALGGRNTPQRQEPGNQPQHHGTPLVKRVIAEGRKARLA